jgi:hypothetical protein
VSDSRSRTPAEDAKRLLDWVVLDASGDDEQLWALREAFEDGVSLPVEGLVAGAPVSVIEIGYDGNSRRGLTATCLGADGGRHVVAACDVGFPDGTDAAQCVAAYRLWIGIEPSPSARPQPQRPHRPSKAQPGDLAPGSRVELVVVAPRTQAARCRILDTGQEITLRSSDVWDAVPGEIITVTVRKQWSYARHPYLSGDVEGRRLDVAALGLVPLQLGGEWPWDPAEEYWGEEGEPLPEWAEPIVAYGPRRSYEMEQVLPGEDPDDLDSDPIIAASQLNQAGDRDVAQRLLVDALATDLRCLDAYAHLGNFAFDRPQDAIRYYETGVRIGQLSLPEGFDGLLPWGRIDNRPFLRCLHGYGLCLWRVGRSDQAAAVFERMLWLNPADNQGVRGLLPAVRSGEPWQADA